MRDARAAGRAARRRVGAARAAARWAPVAGARWRAWLALGAARRAGTRARRRVAMLPLFVVPPRSRVPARSAMTVLDVGQGLAVVVATARHALLYDTGTALDGDGRRGRAHRRAVPARGGHRAPRRDGRQPPDTRPRGRRDARCCSTVPVGRAARRSLDDDASDRRAPARARVLRSAARRAQRWAWDGVAFEVLHPPAAPLRRPGPQDQRPVLRAAHRVGRTAARSSPATSRRRASSRCCVERRDALRRRRAGRAAPRQPHVVDAAVRRRGRARRSPCSRVGYRNRFGHPRPDVVARYEPQGAQLRRTDLDGALTFDVASGRRGPGPRAARRASSRARYWRRSARETPDARRAAACCSASTARAPAARSRVHRSAGGACRHAPGVRARAGAGARGVAARPAGAGAARRRPSSSSRSPSARRTRWARPPSAGRKRDRARRAAADAR